MALWGGRFEQPTDPLFKRFNDSLRFDHRLLVHDVRGSIAWAKALERAGVLQSQERERLVSALEDIEKQWGPDTSRIVATGEEDIHSFVEIALIKRVGDLGKKLHTGRSRNDQVATDLRLWVVDETLARVRELSEVARSLVTLAEREQKTVMPGYTHLQRAQPILFAHWAMAYYEMFKRDMIAFTGAGTEVMVCPLGSGALAGTAYPIDREALARDLGFVAPSQNSLDAVSDRDFALRLLSTAVTCAIHLSRLAEDLTIYTSGEFALVELSDSVTSGSSLMPQKKNPDSLELIRGKTGRILGAYASLATTLKGLPLAYNKDMQEDKEPLFDAMDTLSMCLRMLPPVLDGMKVNREACLRAAKGGYSNATELADYLVSKGAPFREAHEITGRIVRHAIDQRKPIEDLPISDFQKFDKRIGQDVFASLSIDALLAKRSALGGTSPQRVAEAIRNAKQAVNQS